MSAHAPHMEGPLTARANMARWRMWLFDLLARWEETSIARSLGIPVDRLVLVDLSEEEQ